MFLKIKKSISLKFIFLCLMLFFSTLFALPDVAGTKNTRPIEKCSYYTNMTKDQFLINLIPKEKFLLGFVKNITLELQKRRREGADISELGIKELITPEEKLVADYNQELDLLVKLMDEILALESQAKRKIDLEALAALSKLKQRLHQLLAQKNMEIAKAAEAKSKPEQRKNTATEEPKGVTEKTINSVFEEWQYNRILSYKVKYTEYEFLRTRLLRIATPIQEERMFRRSLRTALDSYNKHDLPLARIQLNDLIVTYGADRMLDDVYYYAGESCYGMNLLDESLYYYQQLTRKFSQSDFAAKALVKQAFIYYIYGDYKALSDSYNKVLAQKNQLDDELLGVVSYLVGFVHYLNGASQKALSVLANVRPGTKYYFPGIYLTASCYFSIGDHKSGLPIYQKILNEPNKGDRNKILTQIQNNTRLKMGMIYYELGSDEKAVQYFNQVSENFSQYDLSLMGKAWSAFRSGRPGEALKNVEEVLHASLLSNYAYEARVLAASSKDLLGQSDEAINDLEKVYAAGYSSKMKEKERKDSIRGRIDEFELTQEELLEAKDREQFGNLDHIRLFLQNVHGKNTPGSENTRDNEFAAETAKMKKKIASLDRLEKQASNDNNNKAITEIRDLRRHMLTVLDDHTRRFSITPAKAGDDPLIKKMGTSEFLGYTFNSLLTETLNNKDQVHRSIARFEDLLVESKQQEDFSVTIQLEIEKEEMKDYYGKLNQYEIWLRENMPGDVNIEIDRWASFSGYGISSINFARIKECETKIEQMAGIIENIDYIFREKRRNMDNRIQGLLLDVADIEEQMRLEADTRAKLEKERFFKVDYFNKRKHESVIKSLGTTEKAKNNKSGEGKR